MALNPDETNYLKRLLLANGPEGLSEAIASDLNSFENVRIRICIIGESGAGKSSFINTIRGQKASDTAKAGPVQTTLEIKQYPDPRYPNIVYCDVPGVGTTEFPKETYLEKISVSSYDFFIILSANRFSENDAWLVKEIIKLDRKLYFVRTKIDVDISNRKYDNPGETTEQTMDRIMRDCRKNLISEKLTYPTILLINTHDADQFDFPNLIKWLINDASELQREVLILALSKSDLEEKRRFFEKNTFKVALLSSLGALIPIPGLGIYVDVQILMRETQKYKTAFRTDERTLQIIANRLGVPVDQFINIYGVKSSVILMSTASFASFLAGIGATVAANTASFVLPIVGHLLSTLTSYPVSVFLQRKILQMCYDEAVKIHGIFLENVTGN